MAVNLWAWCLIDVKCMFYSGRVLLFPTTSHVKRAKTNARPAFTTTPSPEPKYSVARDPGTPSPWIIIGTACKNIQKKFPKVKPVPMVAAVEFSPFAQLSGRPDELTPQPPDLNISPVLGTPGSRNCMAVRPKVLTKLKEAPMRTHHNTIPYELI